MSVPSGSGTCRCAVCRLSRSKAEQQFCRVLEQGWPREDRMRLYRLSFAIADGRITVEELG